MNLYHVELGTEYDYYPVEGYLSHPDVLTAEELKVHIREATFAVVKRGDEHADMRDFYCAVLDEMCTRGFSAYVIPEPIVAIREDPMFWVDDD